MLGQTGLQATLVCQSAHIAQPCSTPLVDFGSRYKPDRARSTIHALSYFRFRHSPAFSLDFARGDAIENPPAG